MIQARFLQEEGVEMDQSTNNRREYFRLDFPDLTATMQVFEVQQNPVFVEPRTVTVINASGGGLYVKTDVDLPIRQGIYATFAFSLQGQPYLFRGYLKRKLDDLTAYYYGVQFIDVDEHDRGTLLSTLGRLQIERSRRLRT